MEYGNSLAFFTKLRKDTFLLSNKLKNIREKYETDLQYERLLISEDIFNEFHLLEEIQDLENILIKLEESLWSLEEMLISDSKKIQILEIENKTLSHSELKLKIQLKNNEKSLIKYIKSIDYFRVLNRHFDYNSLRKACQLLDEIFFLARKILDMEEKGKKFVFIIIQIENNIGLFEDLFYEQNFKPCEEVTISLKNIDRILSCWKSYYQGYEVGNKLDEITVYSLNLSLLKLHFLCTYKKFEKFNMDIVDVRSLFEYMLKEKKLSNTYDYSRFIKEINKLLQKKYFNLDKYFIKRINKGKVYIFLKSFMLINYNFELLRSYNKYSYIYICGCITKGIIKVGVSKSKENLCTRLEDARFVYNNNFDNDSFQIIKVIETPNAFNLEKYIKRRYKKNRHPSINSTEWFLLNRDDIKYFEKEMFFGDLEFKRIYDFYLDVKTSNLDFHKQ